MMRRAARAAGVACLALAVSAHVGSPDVFFRGRAGPYELGVVIRPPEVVPGVARVTVRVSRDVERVSIRPVFWRAGSRGAPSADEARRMQGDSGTFQGSLWLMARGAYGVDVIVEGARGVASVLVPVASVATGRLEMTSGLTVILLGFGVFLCVGLITIVYKGAGESLLSAHEQMDARRRNSARRVGAIAVPIVALAVLGGARWWGAVDRDYERTMYRPSPLVLRLDGDVLHLAATDTLWQPPRRPSGLVADHGKLMHLFLVRGDDARAFAHLHPRPVDSSAVPAFVAKLPALPPGRYHVFGDVVHETGFERTLVGTLDLTGSASQAGAAPITADADDAWFVGDASRDSRTILPDGSTMELASIPNGPLTAGREVTLRITVRDPRGQAARLQPYLGMPAHGVIVRTDGAVYVHLHPMGTITNAAQATFAARDRGDTTSTGQLRLAEHAPQHVMGAAAATDTMSSVVEFPYAFPKSGSYRLFVQARREGRVLTGAFAVAVTEASGPTP